MGGIARDAGLSVEEFKKLCSLNSDARRAPQLQAGVGWLLNSFLGIIILEV